jgi:hypothetical protein
VVYKELGKRLQASADLKYYIKLAADPDLLKAAEQLLKELGDNLAR